MIATIIYLDTVGLAWERLGRDMPTRILNPGEFIMDRVRRRADHGSAISSDLYAQAHSETSASQPDPA
jgi:hypothetical protein